MPTLYDILQELQFDDEPAPNKFTMAVGKLVREARDQAGLSQTELARKTYRRRATISNIETGKSEPALLTLVRIADVLRKPIAYFLPMFLYEHMTAEELDREAEELLIQFARISTPTLRQLAVEQVRGVADAEFNERRNARLKP